MPRKHVDRSEHAVLSARDVGRIVMLTDSRKARRQCGPVSSATQLDRRHNADDRSERSPPSLKTPKHRAEITEQSQPMH
jgi:hypothetical protein